MLDNVCPKAKGPFYMIITDPLKRESSRRVLLGPEYSMKNKHWATTTNNDPKRTS